MENGCGEKMKENEKRTAKKARKKVRTYIRRLITYSAYMDRMSAESYTEYIMNAIARADIANTFIIKNLTHKRRN